MENAHFDGTFAYPDYPEMKADFSIPQHYDRYRATDHAVWQQLWERQMKLLPGRACSDYLRALKRMPATAERIPRFEEVNELLYKTSGWELVAVPGLVPDITFFTHLAAKAFPVTHWIRKPEQMDYLQEPDLFHDFFGHVPMLMNPDFANYIAAYGRGGLRALRLGDERYLKYLARLYWYTVEFGLMREQGELRIYGAGILSSPGEVLFSLESDSPNRIAFDMKRIMQTDYVIDDYQESYWVIDSVAQLFGETQQDFKPLYASLDGSGSISPGTVLPSDNIIHHGTAAHHRARGKTTG